jgi:signal transduction histidine kinase
VTARRLNENRLELRVHDDGPGLTNGHDPLGHGTGLSTTKQRIHLLYGDGSRASLVAANAPEGGFAVTLRIPARTLEPPRT